MSFNEPIFGQSEEVFMIVEVTPKSGYKVVYTGSSDDCIYECETSYDYIEPKLYTMHEITCQFSFMILSSKLINEAYYSFPKQRYTEKLHTTGYN